MLRRSFDGRRAATLESKVRFLSRPEAYGPLVQDVEARETHMSWVFLTSDRVYKLKKAGKRPFLDFSTLEKRRFFCDEELRLNRRLAAETYLRVLPLRRTIDGHYGLGDKGRVVDWLVKMKRLRADDMLDRRIATGRLAPADIVAIVERLAQFYSRLPPQRSQGRLYVDYLVEQQKLNRAALLRPEFELATSAVEAVDGTDEAVTKIVPEIRARVSAGWIVEGHGDLRPEHVWLGNPLQIIDCLEFSRPMRTLDPYDEVNYLGMECDVLGAAWIKRELLDALADRLGGRPSPELLAAYGAFRALLRARLSIVHLLEKPVRKAEKWRPLALRYLEQARRELAGADRP